ncbi:MAG: diguanylate cyclase [Gemmataceae bacterium]
MKWFSLPLRASVSLTCLTLSLLCVAFTAGLVPDGTAATLQARKALCEEIGFHCSYLAQKGDLAAFQPTLRALLQRNPDILSVGVRAGSGKLLFGVGDHEAAWASAPPVGSSSAHTRVPIAQNGKLWGTVEVSFKPPAVGPLVRLLGSPFLALLLFMTGVGFAVYSLYVHLLFRQLDLAGGTAVPRRVRTALNTLAEGVVILDEQQQIVMANKAFASLVGRPSKELEGQKIAELGWAGGPAAEAALPWEKALEAGEPQVGAVMELQVDDRWQRILSVNTAPITAEDGSRRGAMATFDNLTTLERKNSHLRKLLGKLRKSRAEIRGQNQQLKILATRDPLTSCLNRRAFFQEFELHWAASKQGSGPLSCIMTDVDHFKSINDRFGHSVGDQVLQHVAATLRSMVRKRDLVCRYGGEEFCILLPGIDLEDALQVAERIRAALAGAPCGQVQVTVSLGVSAVRLGAGQPSELLDQADKALYCAKHGGRNRVIGWHQVPTDQSVEKIKARPAETRTPEPPSVSIPFHAVTALVAALGQRHADTAEHSRRVSDLCVGVARRLLSQTGCYILEVAALLHDIGKLGVPDAVLLKAGALTDEEWKVVRAHQQMGEDIIASAFSCKELTDILRSYHFWYGGSLDEPDQPHGDGIPLGARILAIADAYDSMTADQVYRKARSRDDAFAELRDHAGRQFDPDLVERFIAVVLERNDSRPTPNLSVDKQLALQIGMQIEKLAGALDARDTVSLRSMARQLRATATENGVAPIAEVAGQLERAAEGSAPSVELTRLTVELLELCRATYTAYLPAGDDRDGDDDDLAAVGDAFAPSTRLAGKN